MFEVASDDVEVRSFRSVTYQVLVKYCGRLYWMRYVYSGGEYELGEYVGSYLIPYDGPADESLLGMVG